MPHHLQATENAFLQDGHGVVSVLLQRGEGFGTVPQTGEENHLFGVFASECCRSEIVISSGAKFPACPNHPDDITTWNPIEVGPDNVTVQKSNPPSAA
jgi:hypothetical protein